MRIKETKLYTYAELSDASKSKARDWWRESRAGDNFFAEYVTDEFHETLKAFGFDVMQRRGPHPVRSTVEWSGFCSQGDGAAFSGQWRAADFKPDALLADRPATYGEPVQTSKENAELHRVAGELRACVDGGLTYASIESKRGFFMSLGDADHNEPERATDARVLFADQKETEVSFIEAARDLAHGFYKALETEYDYQNSDECVAENIIANEYEFTEEGVRS